MVSVVIELFGFTEYITLLHVGDGFLEMKELENAMKNVDQMGVPGSKWKFYVDPAQDVICYHNFHADEKVFEYQMKDDKLRVFFKIVIP